MRSKIILFVALCMGVLTTVLFYDYMQKYNVQQQIQTHSVDIVVAKQAIRTNQIVTPAMVELKKIPEAAIPAYAVRNMGEINGKFTTAEIQPGEAILSHRLKTQAEESQLITRKIKEGYRAVSIGIGFVESVSNLIEPGDMVDIVLSTGQNEIKKSELLLEKVKVLAVGRRMVVADTQTPYAAYSSVTFELMQDNAVKVINAQQRGEIHLIVHSNIVAGKE